MKPEENKVAKNRANASYNREADSVVTITYYTDPLCCWSWAMEPAWRRLLYEFQGVIQVRYCMGGLLPGWKDFNDPVQLISKPVQMGPVWMEAGHVSGMPVRSKIWIENPPASSYLACMAVKSAQRQSAAAGERYLRLLREAIMIHEKNIALLSVLMEIARLLNSQQPGLLNLEAFSEALTGEAGKADFEKDLQEVNNLHITRFPTWIFRKTGQPSLLMKGYQPYRVLRNTLRHMDATLRPVYSSIDEAAYTRFWGMVTPRELQEVKEL